MATDITSSTIFSSDQRVSHSKIYAGPGAGKTHFLVQNIKDIVSQDEVIKGSRDCCVLCITYTNAAADEIKARLAGYSNFVITSTIHTFVSEFIIKRFQTDLRKLIKKDFGIVVSDKKCIASQIEGFGVLHGIEKEEVYAYVNSIHGTSAALNYSKMAMSSVEVDVSRFIDNEVEKKLKSLSTVVDADIEPIKSFVWGEAGVLSHDEVLYFGYRIIQENPIALLYLRTKFPYVFVDEFQDTSPLQTKIIKTFGHNVTRITVVGDVAQSIYSFQGARPSDFTEFSIEGREIEEYVINGNRRSCQNIVNFCNFLRQKDVNVFQCSLRNENSSKKDGEVASLFVLVGNSPTVLNRIEDVLNSGGVVLTRTWAAAFSYIRHIDATQEKLLKDVYNNYYGSQIQIRESIMGLNNVTWVRAFRFIFMLWEGYRKRSLNRIIEAIDVISKFNPKGMSAYNMILLEKCLNNIFTGIDENSPSKTVRVIQDIEACLSDQEYQSLLDLFSEGKYEVPIFDDLDKDKLKSAVGALSWAVSYKLFTEVFAEGSKYMTVHQAKGMEWNKVVVSVEPLIKKGEQHLANLFINPNVIGDNRDAEFNRIFYVACSRAKDELYIHLKYENDVISFSSAIEKYNAKHDQKITYTVIR